MTKSEPGKVAVLSMDVEDWYHLDYFRDLRCDREQTLLDGVEVFRGLLERHGIPATFFVVGELVAKQANLLARLAAEGHELAVHGWDHTRPLTMSPEAMEDDAQRTRDALREAVGTPANGYRAPCFSLDRERLDRLYSAGFAYDSSHMPFEAHPLYGALDLEGFDKRQPGVYCRDRFLEFPLSVSEVGGRTVPISGGAYFRVFPWLLTRFLVELSLRKGTLYTFYVHPFEVSARGTPRLPSTVRRADRLRFTVGRSRVRSRLGRLIALLQRRGFRFTTFADLRRQVLGNSCSDPEE